MFGFRVMLRACALVQKLGSKAGHDGTESDWQLCMTLHEGILTDSQITLHFASCALSLGHQGSVPITTVTGCLVAVNDP